jgi:hypothetical protein
MGDERYWSEATRRAETGLGGSLSVFTKRVKSSRFGQNESAASPSDHGAVWHGARICGVCRIAVDHPNNNGLDPMPARTQLGNRSGRLREEPVSVPRAAISPFLYGGAIKSESPRIIFTGAFDACEASRVKALHYRRHNKIACLPGIESESPECLISPAFSGLLMNASD